MPPTEPSPLPPEPALKPAARGVPSWVGIRTEQPAALRSFYERLLGWSAEAHDDGVVAHVGDHPVAMIVPGSGWDAERWFCFFASDAIEREQPAVERLGGRIITPARHTEGVGRTALVQDPQGASFGLIEADASRTAPPLNTPGALRWSELDTATPDESFAFYSGLFGYERQAAQTPTGATYTRLLLDGVPVVGILEIEQDWPGAVPPRWLAYFAVADVHDSARLLRELGGSLVIGPLASADGEVAIARDPAGATFCLVQPADGDGR